MQGEWKGREGGCGSFFKKLIFMGVGWRIGNWLYKKAPIEGASPFRLVDCFGAERVGRPKLALSAQSEDGSGFPIWSNAPLLALPV